MQKKRLLFRTRCIGCCGYYLITHSNKGVPVIVVPRSIAIAHALRNLVPQQQEVPHKETTPLLWQQEWEGEGGQVILCSEGWEYERAHRSSDSRRGEGEPGRKKRLKTRSDGAMTLYDGEFELERQVAMPLDQSKKPILGCCEPVDSPDEDFDLSPRGLATQQSTVETSPFQVSVANTDMEGPQFPHWGSPPESHVTKAENQAFVQHRPTPCLSTCTGSDRSPTHLNHVSTRLPRTCGFSGTRRSQRLSQLLEGSRGSCRRGFRQSRHFFNILPLVIWARRQRDTRISGEEVGGEGVGGGRG
jgi:hypothetical protein